MASDEINVEMEELSRLVRRAGSDFSDLAGIVRVFAKANPLKDTFNVSLKQARQLLKDSKGNVDAVRAALKGAGTSGRDLSMVMRQLNSDLDKARRSAMGFEGIWSRIFSPKTIAYAAHAMQALTGGFSVLKTVMGGPLGLASGVISKGLDLGKGLLETVVEAAEFRQNALTGMSFMLGGDMDKARKLFADAQQLAQDTPLDTDKVISGIKTFLTQGFTEDQSKFLYRVVADQASKFLDQPETEHNVVTAFSRLQGRGYATSEDIESFRVANFQGKGIFQQLLMQPGMKELMSGKSKLTGTESEEEIFKKIKTVLGTGLVGKGTLMNAVVGSMYEGQKLEEGPGSLAKKFGKESLTGALSNAKNAFGDMLKSMDLVNTKGFKALIGGVDNAGKPFEGFLSKLTTAIGTSGKLKETITGLVDSVLGGFSKITANDIERVIATVGKLAEGVISFFKHAWEWLDKLIHAEPGEFLSNVGDVLVDVGKFIGVGIWDGVKNAGSIIAEQENKKEQAFRQTHGMGSDALKLQAKRMDIPYQELLGRYDTVEKERIAQGKSRPTFENIGDISSQVQYVKDVLAFGANRTMMTKMLEEERFGMEQRSISGIERRESERSNFIKDVLDSPSTEIPEFGDGGYVNRPTLAVVGDKGGEYMVPEGKMGGISITVPIQLFYAGSSDPDDLAAALEPVAMRCFRNAWQRLAMEMG